MPSSPTRKPSVLQPPDQGWCCCDSYRPSVAGCRRWTLGLLSTVVADAEGALRHRAKLGRLIEQALALLKLRPPPFRLRDRGSAAVMLYGAEEA